MWSFAIKMFCDKRYYFHLSEQYPSTNIKIKPITAERSEGGGCLQRLLGIIADLSGGGLQYNTSLVPQSVEL